MPNGAILFSAKGEFGRELYKVENGQLSLVKDLKTGEEDSSGSIHKYLTD